VIGVNTAIYTQSGGYQGLGFALRRIPWWMFITTDRSQPQEDTRLDRHPLQPRASRAP